MALETDQDCLSARIDRQVLSPVRQSERLEHLRLALNKNSLKQQQDQLSMFRRFLPSLDLKRQQLQAAWKEARTELERLEANEVEYRKSLEPLLSLLGSSTLRTQDLSRLVQVRNVVIDEENALTIVIVVLWEITLADYK